MRKKKRLTWPEKIADAIEEAKTFDLSQDEDGFPTVHGMIAKYMLREFDFYLMTQQMGHYVGKIKNNLHHSINLLKERGIKVWIKRPLGIKAIQAISIDDVYHLDDAIRMKSHWCEATLIAFEKMEDKHPKLLPPNVGKRFKRVIGDAKQLRLIK